MHQRAVHFCCRTSEVTLPFDSYWATKHHQTHLGLLKVCRRSSHSLTNQQEPTGHPVEALPDDRGLAVPNNGRTRGGVPLSKWAGDIYVDDLTATLEAHRATNRVEAKIRRMVTRTWSGFKRISVQNTDMGQLDEANTSKADPMTTMETAKSSPVDTEDAASGTDGHKEAIKANAKAFRYRLIVSDQRKWKPTVSKRGPRKLSQNELRPADITRSITPVDPNGSHLDPGNDSLELESKSRELQWVQSHWPADSIQTQVMTGGRHHVIADEKLDYRACWLPPQGPFNVVDHPAQRPYLAFLEDRSKNKEGDSFQRLHDELKAFQAYMTKSFIEEEAQKWFIADIQKLIRPHFPHNPLVLMGSHNTGLADRLSDFDFSLTFPLLEKKPWERGPSPLSIRNQRALRSALRTVQSALRSSDLFQSPVELIFARIPIVKAQHCVTGFQVEIQTLATPHIAQEFVASYLCEFPTLRTLYIVIRSALHIRYLNNVHLGGLGSYSIFIMVVNALKHAPITIANDDLANQFIHVLNFYGNADLHKYGFSADPPLQFLKKGEKVEARDEKNIRMMDPVLNGIDTMKKYDARKPYLLCLQDPADTTNDLGRQAYGIKHVRQMFKRFSRQLKEMMGQWDEGGKRSTHGLLGSFLDANYSTLHHQRSKLRAWILRRDPSLIETLEKNFNFQDYKLTTRDWKIVKREQAKLEKLEVANYQTTAKRLADATNRKLVQNQNQYEMLALSEGVARTTTNASSGSQQPQDEPAIITSASGELQVVRPNEDLGLPALPPDNAADVPEHVDATEQSLGSALQKDGGKSSNMADTSESPKALQQTASSTQSNGWRKWDPSSPPTIKKATSPQPITVREKPETKPSLKVHTPSADAGSKDSQSSQSSQSSAPTTPPADTQNSEAQPSRIRYTSSPTTPTLESNGRPPRSNTREGQTQQAPQTFHEKGIRPQL